MASERQTAPEDFLHFRKIQGTHWRQERFSFHDKNATSEYTFTVRVQNGKRRVVLRGVLEVDWTEAQNAQENFLPGKLVVRNLQREERTGEPGFVEQPVPSGAGPVLVFDLNHDGLPEIIFPAANTVS